MDGLKKVLLISMPFVSIKYPAIGISLLKSRLHEEGIPCDIKYFGIIFADMVGLDRYEDICEYKHGVCFLGERFFAQEYFDEQLPGEAEYKEHLKRLYGMPRDDIDALHSMRDFAAPFLGHCMESTSWEDYDIIGFSSMFEQNMASIALAHRIKRFDPAKTIIFGGPNCEEKMGSELHRCFPFIDYVCSGEADQSFPELVKRILNKEPATDIPGIVYRKNDESIVSESPQIVEDLDSLPYPDYDDYFAQLEHSSFSPSVCKMLPMETSRGCWWGERSQCTFCGLNGCSIDFRSKSKDRVIEELTYLIEKYVKKYSLTQVYMVDNILDMKYFKQLLPELKEKQFPVEIFYETKANLNKDHVRTLSEAGITFIQPGIESLNSHVLRLMGKGVSALQNIQLLKYCKQFGVVPGWSILTGFPGERVKDYREMVDLICSKVTHLPPPSVNAHFNLERFSPYFNNSEEYGILKIRPESDYRFVYPFDESRIFNLAYFFEFDYREDVKPSGCDEELSEAVAYWNECYENKEYLCSREISPSTLLIEDGRSNALFLRITLELAQKNIYEYCDRIRSFSSILSYIQKRYSNYPVRVRDIKDFLEEMVSLNFMVSEDDKYLSIAIPIEESH